jgi:hypothetical protein
MACFFIGERAGMQLVLSIGPVLDPQQIKSLPANAIVVDRAPQIELLKRSALYENRHMRAIERTDSSATNFTDRRGAAEFGVSTRPAQRVMMGMRC